MKVWRTHSELHFIDAQYFMMVQSFRRQNDLYRSFDTTSSATTVASNYKKKNSITFEIIRSTITNFDRFIGCLPSPSRKREWKGFYLFCWYFDFIHSVPSFFYYLQSHFSQRVVTMPSIHSFRLSLFLRIYMYKQLFCSIYLKCLEASSNIGSGSSFTVFMICFLVFVFIRRFLAVAFF